MLKNPNHANETWSVGEACYYHETWSDAIHEARIKAIERVHGTATVHDAVNGVDTTQKLENLFKTHSEGMDALVKAHDAQIKEYEDSVTTVQELLQFALDHPIASASGEYTDWEARAAFIARAEALLGVQLRN